MTVSWLVVGGGKGTVNNTNAGSARACTTLAPVKSTPPHRRYVLPAVRVHPLATNGLAFTLLAHPTSPTVPVPASSTAKVTSVCVAMVSLTYQYMKGGVATCCAACSARFLLGANVKE